MKIRIYILTIFLLLLCSCNSHTKLTSQEIKKYQTSGSLYTLWYKGSDSNYHYFSHLSKTTRNFKVLQSELKVSKMIGYGSSENYLLVTRIENNTCIIGYRKLKTQNPNH